jgi:hypothetical protein
MIPKKFRQGRFGQDSDQDKIREQIRKIRTATQKHDQILKNRELGDVGFPMKRFIMEDENGNPVSIRPKSDGTWTITPYDEDSDT